MNCGMECIKYLLFVFNFVCALGGLFILVLGAVCLTNPELEVFKQANPDLPSFAATTYALIVIGAIIFIITFFGCCGAIRESHCMIVTYGILLLTLLVIQVAIASYIFIKFNGEDAEKSIDSAVEKLFKSYFDEKPDVPVQPVINNLQKLVDCCGFNSYRDYYENEKNREKFIPGSCCKHEQFNNSCQVGVDKISAGCKDKLHDFFKKYSSQFGTVALCIAGIELIGIIFSFCLANSILNVERRGYKV